MFNSKQYTVWLTRFRPRRVWIRICWRVLQWYLTWKGWGEVGVLRGCFSAVAKAGFLVMGDLARWLFLASWHRHLSTSTPSSYCTHVFSPFADCTLYWIWILSRRNPQKLLHVCLAYLQEQIKHLVVTTIALVAAWLHPLISCPTLSTSLPKPGGWLTRLNDVNHLEGFLPQSQRCTGNQEMEQGTQEPEWCSQDAAKYTCCNVLSWFI